MSGWWEIEAEFERMARIKARIKRLTADLRVRSR
jgi:hypothetical protein